jgi:hypothetical protein
MLAGLEAGLPGHDAAAFLAMVDAQARLEYLQEEQQRQQQQQQQQQQQ